MSELPTHCEKCGDEGIGFNDDGEFLCEDCLFHWFIEDETHCS